ncbi:DUF7118 family protein [Halospeciosus flavus]|uniref:Uncharacterized protein n=1 Tax=Halospeciosus flavus TaxID=3032283 RepID=A0ABD5Z6W4_9EURY|nr:hypothetical protein [Halospeciosus flavus]
MTDSVAAVVAAAERLEARRETVADPGEDALRELADALADVRAVLDRYEEDATGYGDFQRYVAFQDDLVATVEELPEDLPERETFEDLLPAFQKKTLSETDFEEARAALDEAEQTVEPLYELEDARERYDEARRQAAVRLTDLRERVDDLERLVDLGDADFDAPVERLREPVEAYNAAVRDAFDDFRASASARELLDFLDRAQTFPLVGFDEPPEALSDFVEDHEAGTETVSRLLELADFSHSKLGHYVDDPAALKRAVGGNRTYLAGLSADPLTVAWPPRPAEELRYRADELVSLVGRLVDRVDGDASTAVEHLRTVRDLTRDDDFERVRRAAVAREELTDEERERAAGDVEAELADARADLEELELLLDEYPPR